MRNPRRPRTVQVGSTPPPSQQKRRCSSLHLESPCIPPGSEGGGWCSHWDLAAYPTLPAEAGQRRGGESSGRRSEERILADDPTTNEKCCGYCAGKTCAGKTPCQTLRKPSS